MSSKDKINTTVIGILESTINDLQVELMAEGIAFRKRSLRWYFLTSVSSIDISDGSAETGVSLHLVAFPPNR